MNQEEKEKRVINYFLNNPTKYIREISEATNIPKSSVQRYLEKHKKKIIPGTNITIEEQLKQNKRNGQREGGIHFFEQNDSIKSGNGKFIGSIKTTRVEKERAKERDIEIIANYYISNFPKSLTDTAKELEEIGAYSRDYIYDCLKDYRLPTIIGPSKATLIRCILSQNKRNHSSLGKNHLI